MNEKVINRLERLLRVLGYVWAGIGLTIVILSNAILIGKFNIKIWFIPINPRDSTLTILLLLVPVILLITSMVLRKKFRRSD